MIQPDDRLRPGDPVFHPKFGLGTVKGVTSRDRIQKVRDPLPEDGMATPEDYYDIELAGGGTLQVPVSRATSVGLRLANNGIARVMDCLQSTAEDLPVHPRERAVALRMREQHLEPEALAHAVRDMLAASNGRTLTASEKTWLSNACERLGAEIAFVDGIGLSQARSAVWEIVTRLSGRSRAN